MPLIGTEKPKPQPIHGELLVSTTLTADNGLELLNKYDSYAKDSFSSITLNFEKCKRVDTGGLLIITQLGEKAKADSKLIEVVNIDNTIYKALKLTGKMDDPVFYFPHRGVIGKGAKANLPNC